MKKILIASPIRGGMSPSYVRAVIALLNSSLCRGDARQYAIDFAWTSGTSVAMARDEIANLFLQRGDDELIQWDADLGVADPQMMVSMFNRLLSHDVDIVGGAYVGHNFLSQFHGAAHDNHQSIGQNGLLRMAQIPLGFSKIKRGVFTKIEEDHPYLRYQMRETGMDRPKSMFEFFPNGIAGPNTGQGKIDRMKKVLTNPEGVESPHDRYDRILEILNDADYSQNIMYGEDFFFCYLARQSGFEMFIDNNLVVPHSTDVRLPVKNQLLLQALMEEWRWGDKVNAKEFKSHLEALGKMLNPDIL
jgi:hypothetical protein